MYTALHSLWYKKDLELNKFIKIVPLNISEMFSEISLAYWIMDDGFFDSSAYARYAIKLRNKIKDKYRIRISKTSMDRVIYLVKPLASQAY